VEAQTAMYPDAAVPSSYEYCWVLFLEEIWIWKLIC